MPCVVGFVAALLALIPAPAGAQPAEPPLIRLVFYANYRAEEVNHLYTVAREECSARFNYPEIVRRVELRTQQLGIKFEQAHPDPELARLREQLVDLSNKATACQAEHPSRTRAETITRDVSQISDFLVPLHATPNGPIVGRIKLPTLTAKIQPLTYTWGSDATERQLNLDDPPYRSYDPPNHTVIAVQGDWLQLARNPFPIPVWLNWKAVFQAEPMFESMFDQVQELQGVIARDLSTGQERRIDRENVVFLSRVGDDVIFRLEQPGDYACGDAVQPIEPSTQFRIPISAILDADGRLTPKSAHPAGC